MSMAWVAVGTVALGMGTSYLSSRAQSKAAGQAVDAQTAATMYGIDAQMEMFDRSMEMFQPFYDAGIEGLKKYERMPASARAPVLPSTSIDFEFDPNDKMYKIKQQEGEEAVNRALAARGMTNSRPGINALTDFNTKLIAEETDKQYGRAVDKYGRDYTSAMDKFNIENKITQQNLGKFADLINIGSGAAGSMGNAMNKVGGDVSSAYAELGKSSAEAEYKKGDYAAGLWQDVGSMPANLMGTYKYGKSAFG